MTKSSATLLREYLDILNEGPPPGVGPNAAPKPKAQQTMQQRADDIEAGTSQAAQGITNFGQGNYAGGAMDVAKGMNTAANAAGMSFWDKLKAGWIAIKAGASAATTSGDPMYAAMGSLGKNAADPMAKWINSPTFEKDFLAGIEAARKNPQADTQLKQMVADYDAKKLTPQSYKAYMQRIIATNAAQQKGQKVDFDPEDSYEVKPTTESKKTFLEFVEDLEFEGGIVSGDGFIIETGEDEGVETYIIESWDDSVLIAADRTTLDILEELGLLGEATPAVTPGAIPQAPTAGQPAAAAPAAQPAASKVQAPKAPPMPQPPQGAEGEPRQNGGMGYDLGQGSLLVVNPDGTRTYSGDFGTFTYDKSGKAIKFSPPGAGGMSATVDLTTGGQTTGYNAGDVSVSQTTNAAGKTTGGSATYSPGTQAQPTTKTFEAEYQGRKVPLGKPMTGDVKKSKVYVKKPNGNIVKVNFGDKKLSIKKHIPGRRKSFRARHNCDNPGPRWKARYWSCRAW